MNLGPAAVNLTYQYLLNQSGTNITLGNNGAVNWNAANIVTRTGDQTINGEKTFTSNVISSVGFGNSQSDNYFGHNASNNSFGVEAENNSFGTTADTSNAFGDGSPTNSFGNSSSTNSFGSSAETNSFGDYVTTSNNFGYSAPNNYFGDAASISNNFGFFAYENFFGSNATFGNNFGDAATTNYFGNNCSDNHFGGGVFDSGIRVLLPEFDGDSSQAGQFGELRVSGSGLYVCTGATGGWRRIFLQSF